MTTYFPEPTRTGSAVRSTAWWVGVAVLLLLELVLGQLAVRLSPDGSAVAAFWPNAGLSVIALTIAPRSRRGFVLAGIFAVSWAANQLAGRGAELSLGYAVANVAEPALVIWWLTRRGRDRPRLHTLDDFIALLAATLAGASVAGLLVALTVLVTGEGAALDVGRAVACSHAAAVLILAPLAMSLLRHTDRRAGRLEAALQWTATLLVAALVFAPGQELPLSFAPFPLLVWGALRLRPREVNVQLLVYAGVATVLTVARWGPFAAATDRSGQSGDVVASLLQVNLLAAALVALPLSLVKTQQLITVDQLTYSHDMVSGLLSSTSGTAILGTTLDGVIEFFNVGAERLSGYRGEDVIDRARLALVLGPDGRLQLTISRGGLPDAARLEALLGELPDSTGGYLTQDWDFVRSDGELRTISVAVSRRLSEDGVPVGYLGVAEDVTARRRHQAVVEAALESEKRINERLAQVDQTKNDFMSTVSHELRTPVTSILGYSQLLMTDESGTMPPMHQQLVGRIERNGRRLMGLIDDMLTMSQLELGDFRFQRTPLDLRETVCNAVGSVQSAAATQQLVLQETLGDEPVRIAGDADKLQRAFTNLLGNAVKFSHAGDVIEVTLTSEDGHAVLRVADNGVGISPEDQTHLFDRFFRGSDAHALAIQGAGLGLSIASSIVAGHEGRIEVLSELGRGSTFVVRLPLDCEGLDRPSEPSRVRSGRG